MRGAARCALHGVAVGLLTLPTQLGGPAWLGALAARRWRPAVLFALYAALSLGAVWAAPLAGRVALPCLGDGSLVSASPVFCALNRRFARPEAAAVAGDLAEHMAAAHPGTRVATLDAGFPLGGLMLPHLSHRDGRDLDLALSWRDEAGRPRPGESPSALGYWGFDEGPTECPPRALTLR